MRTLRAESSPSDSGRRPQLNDSITPDQPNSRSQGDPVHHYDS